MGEMRPDRLCNAKALSRMPAEPGQDHAARTPHTEILKSPPLRYRWQSPCDARRSAPADSGRRENQGSRRQVGRGSDAVGAVANHLRAGAVRIARAELRTARNDH